MKNEILKLREQYANSRSEKKHTEIDRQMKELSEKDPDTFESVMLELLKETADRAEEISMRERLKEVLPAISLSYIATTYFGKTRHWLYQRINGLRVNGKPASFSADERIILENAFKDLGNKLSLLRVSL